MGKVLVSVRSSFIFQLPHILTPRTALQLLFSTSPTTTSPERQKAPRSRPQPPRAGMSASSRALRIQSREPSAKRRLNHPCERLEHEPEQMRDFHARRQRVATKCRGTKEGDLFPALQRSRLCESSGDRRPQLAQVFGQAEDSVSVSPANSRFPGCRLASEVDAGRLGPVAAGALAGSGVSPFAGISCLRTAPDFSREGADDFLGGRFCGGRRCSTWNIRKGVLGGELREAWFQK